MAIKINNDAIEYTKGDTFELIVESDSGFEEGDTLKLIIADSETAAAKINNTYALNADGTFTITLSERDKQNLSIRTYLYKIIHTNIVGNIVTKFSGEFIVKWGA